MKLLTLILQADDRQIDFGFIPIRKRDVVMDFFLSDRSAKFLVFLMIASGAALSVYSYFLMGKIQFFG